MNVGDLYWVELPSRGGRAQAGRRPAIIAQRPSTLPTILIVPLTSQLDALRFPGTVLVEASKENGLLTLAEMVADQLDLDVLPDETWNARCGPSMSFERYVRREVLGKLSAPLVWGLDEVDRLFTCNFGSEVFGLFRSWHNERSLDPSGP